MHVYIFPLLRTFLLSTKGHIACVTGSTAGGFENIKDVNAEAKHSHQFSQTVLF